MSNQTVAENFWEKGKTFIKFVVDTAREPFLILDKDLNVISANESFYRFFIVSPNEAEGKKIYDIGNKQFDVPHLRELLESILPRSTFFKDFELQHDFPTIGTKVLLLNGRMVYLAEDNIKMIILAMEDVTKQRLLEERMKAYAHELEDKVLVRTKELEARLEELEKMNKFMIGREVKMAELKDTTRTMQEMIDGLQKTVKGMQDAAQTK